MPSWFMSFGCQCASLCVAVAFTSLQSIAFCDDNTIQLKTVGKIPDLIAKKLPTIVRATVDIDDGRMFVVWGEPLGPWSLDICRFDGSPINNEGWTKPQNVNSATHLSGTHLIAVSADKSRNGINGDLVGDLQFWQSDKLSKSANLQLPVGRARGADCNSVSGFFVFGYGNGLAVLDTAFACDHEFFKSTNPHFDNKHCSPSGVSLGGLYFLCEASNVSQSVKLVESPSLEPVVTLDSFWSDQNRIALSPDTNWVAAVNLRGTPVFAPTRNSGNMQWIRSIENAKIAKFLPNTVCLAIITNDALLIWDLLNGKECAHFPGTFSSFACGPANRLFVVNKLEDDTMHVLELRNGRTTDDRQFLKLEKPHIDRLWDCLCDANPNVAYAALCELSEIQQSTDFIAEKWSHLPHDDRDIAQLIAMLGSEEFDKRHTAHIELINRGIHAVPHLVDAAEQSSVPQIRNESLEIIDDIKRLPIRTPDELRWYRAIQVLLRVHSAPSKAVLTDISKSKYRWRLARAASNAIVGFD